MTTNKSWLKDAVIYNILIDRFSKGKSEDEAWSKIPAVGPVFCGGTIRGIIDRLDYIEDLGANTILLTPFHPCIEYHGYHVTDFYGVDPRFGTLEDVKELLASAHKRNIRIIMDLVVNHVSEQHPFFIDVKTNPNSKYKKWFYFKKWPTKYLTYLTYSELPKLNLDNVETREYIIESALFWQKIGFDGFRLDHIIGVPYIFFKELSRAIKTDDPQSVLIGEAVKAELAWEEMKTLKTKNKFVLYLLSIMGFNINILIQKQYTKVFDGLIDFSFRDLVKKYLIGGRPEWITRIVFKLYYSIYPKRLSLISLLDNPDKDRLLYVLKGDKEKYKKIISFQFEQKQPPMLFYGSEAGLTQDHSRKSRPYGDLAIRSKMPWYNIDKEIYSFYKEVISSLKK